MYDYLEVEEVVMLSLTYFEKVIIERSPTKKIKKINISCC